MCFSEILEKQKGRVGPSLPLANKTMPCNICNECLEKVDLSVLIPEIHHFRNIFSSSDAGNWFLAEILRSSPDIRVEMHSGALAHPFSPLW